MKVVILAGGKGTRISEESRLRPKPMVEIGGKPILWHIMRQYASYGFNEFIICCGYKGHMIKEYFVKYYQNNSQLEIRLQDQQVQVIKKNSEPWKVTMVDTGLETLTAGRILKVREYIGEESFLLTYGDGVSDVNIHDLIEFHKKHKKIVTISTTQPEGRFGALRLDDTGKLYFYMVFPKPFEKTYKPRIYTDYISAYYSILLIKFKRCTLYRIRKHSKRMMFPFPFTVVYYNYRLLC